jgi:hypothetical protein
MAIGTGEGETEAQGEVIALDDSSSRQISPAFPNIFNNKYFDLNFRVNGAV